MSLIRKFIGASALSYIVMYTLGALLFALVYSPMEPLDIWVIIVSCLAVLIIRKFGSVFFIVAVEPLCFKKTELIAVTESWFLAVFIMAALFYFALALPAYWLERRHVT